MVKEINFEGKIVFECERCGWIYRNVEIAEKCQEWCEKHNSCNLNITIEAIKVN